MGFLRLLGSYTSSMCITPCVLCKGVRSQHYLGCIVVKRTVLVWFWSPAMKAERCPASITLDFKIGSFLFLSPSSALTLTRHTLLSRLVRIHQAGVEHLDVEPRNVVLSKSRGPVVVNFDGASLDHCCGGLSCRELREVARRLGIDLGHLITAAGDF